MSDIKAVVVTDTCPYCESLLEYLKRQGLAEKVRVINASTKEGLDFAVKYGIRAVPECVVITGNGEKVRVCSKGEFEQLLQKEG